MFEGLKENIKLTLTTSNIINATIVYYIAVDALPLNKLFLNLIMRLEIQR